MYQELREVWNELIAEGSPFAISEAEVNGNTIKTYAEAPPSLRELWLASRAFGDNDYLVYQDERITYGQAHEKVAAIANWLQSQGVEPGDRVAIAMRNYPEWMLSYWATVSIGAAVVGVNAWWIGPELVYGMNDATPKVFIGDQERLGRALEHLDELPPMKFVSVRIPNGCPVGVTEFSELEAEGGALPDISIDPDSDACIFYTSGTTGRPKGAQLTHRGCVNNVMNLAFWANCMLLLNARLGKAPAKTPEDSPVMAGLLTTPLFHVTANNCIAQGATLSGGKLVHMYKWDPTEALKLIETEKVTSFTGVPTMSRELVNHPDFHKYDTSSLSSVGGGGAQVQPDLVGKIDETVATARPQTGYGMTETCGVITSISADFFLDKPESCGPVLPNFDAMTVDAEGSPQSQGETGELWVKGAPVIRGYLNRADATAESITDGWLHTGDIARIDGDGFVYIVDRAKDMVIRGGENVYCAEVESALHEHAAVAECCVFGVPDDRLGEEVGAAIYLRAGTASSEVDAEVLRAHCRMRISPHKIPRFIWFTGEPLPQNANGKFLKRSLRDSLDPADAS